MESYLQMKNTLFTLCMVIFYCKHNVAIYSKLSQNEIEELKDYAVYYSYKQTKEILMKYYNRSEEIKMLVDEYDFRCGSVKTFFKKHYPFITVEAAYRRTRNVVAQRVANVIKARLVGNPPQFMTMSNYFFNDTEELRRAFYSLGVYGAACKTREYLYSSAVIVAGYWVDQTSFGISKMYNTLPSAGSAIYEWPDDLVKPDMVFVINPSSSFPPIPLHPYKPLKTYSFKDKLLDCMLRFRNPSLIEINTSVDNNEAIRSIVSHINKRFDTNFQCG
ncbi:UMP-CMP kinase 2, mitochondrial-like [Macrosteles quadrilineatus]|uniref:UMP-CMP kinase 2, mitochondrial-like n=1 Tax=Macrosteles quadrilineatus TaxID=74068 RepID=UPI0023E24564|nr:UMP-CMP kinase 2, mitochondrial-like [Macrosteles quadrilineatus]